MCSNSLLEKIPYPAMLIHKSRVVKSINEPAVKAGIEIGKYCWDTFGQKASITDDERNHFEETGEIPSHCVKCSFCVADESLEKQQSIVLDLPVGEDIYETHWEPVDSEHYIHFAFPKKG